MKDISQTSHTSTSRQIASFLLLFVGRFLAQYFMAIQLQAIKCTYILNDCAVKTDQIRFVTNIIGLVLILIIMYFQQFLQECVFSDDDVPWAAIPSTANLMSKLEYFVIVILVVFQKDILNLTQFFVLMIPLLVVSTLQGWILIFRKIVINDIVDLAYIIKNSVLWSISLFALVLNLSNIKPDISFYILLVVSLIIFPLLVYL